VYKEESSKMLKPHTEPPKHPQPSRTNKETSPRANKGTRKQITRQPHIALEYHREAEQNIDGSG